MTVAVRGGERQGRRERGMTCAKEPRLGFEPEETAAAGRIWPYSWSL